MQEKRRKKHRESEKERARERERRRKVEEERKEGSGVTSTLDWNLKVAGSIPGSTHREIIHPKTTIKKISKQNWKEMDSWVYNKEIRFY